ncbi:TPA: hypothetical protein ACVPMB_000587 [Enterococcus faecium]|jgi:hypothetical protein
MQVSRFVLLSARAIHVIAVTAFASWANATTLKNVLGTFGYGANIAP